MAKLSIVLSLMALASAALLWSGTSAQEGSQQYRPVTAEELEIRIKCKGELPHEETHQPGLFSFSLDDPRVEQLIKTNTPNSDPYVEESCTSGIDNTTEREVRDVLSLRITGKCHDVLFYADGEAVVCLPFPVRDRGKVYSATTREQREIEDMCKDNLPHPKDTSVSLVEYEANPDGLVPGFYLYNVSTSVTDADMYAEDCFNTVSTPGPTDETVPVIFIFESNTCHDVLFYENTDNPIVCLYVTEEPSSDTGKVYEASNTKELEVEAMCKETLAHPSNSFVSLVEYKSNPEEGLQPGYVLFNVVADYVDDEMYTENCTNLKFSLPEPTNETVPVILIDESGTCHNVLFYVDSDNPIVCLYVFDNKVIRIFDLAPAIITLILSSISIIASAIILVTHIIFPSLRTLPSKVIMNLAAAFLLGDIVLIILTSITIEDPLLSGRDAIILISYYFLYARFVWMALAGFEMCRTIHVGTQLRFNTARRRMQIFLTYVITGWSLPLIPTIIMAIVHFERLEGEDEVGKKSLFGIGGFVITLVPVGLVVLFNVGVLVYLTYVLNKAHQWQVKVSNAITAQRRKTNFSRIFIIILSVLGVTWVTMFLVYSDGITRNPAVGIITSIFNSIQPIFVCITFVGTKKIYRKYRDLFQGKADGKKPDDLNEKRSRFRNRRLFSYLFTDKQLADTVPKYRFRRRNDSKLSNTSVSMLTQDSSHSLVSQPPASNGNCSPPRDEPSLAPISEEQEPETEITEDSPTHITVDLQDSTL